MICIERMLSTRELSRRTGVSDHYIRKWAKEGLIPCCKRPREHPLYPEDEAVEAVMRVLAEGGLKGIGQIPINDDSQATPEDGTAK